MVYVHSPLYVQYMCVALNVMFLCKSVCACMFVAVFLRVTMKQLWKTSGKLRT